MHVVLFLVGVVLAFAGAVLIYTVPVPVVDAGAAALFGSGVLAMVGGLILMGLAAIVRVLNRIAERLEIQPLPLPPVVAVGREDPAPRAARPQAAPAAPSVPAPAAARPSLFGWFGRGSAPVPATAARPTIARTNGEPASATAVDLAPLARAPEEPRAPAPAPVLPPPPAPPPPPPAAAVPPPPVAPPRPMTPRPAVPQPAAPQPVAKPAANGTPETTVYKSGVIDGMAYTLFMDGAIEADLPQGRVKFASIDELQKYLTGKE
jgi:hypothetical protein